MHTGGCHASKPKKTQRKSKYGIKAALELAKVTEQDRQAAKELALNHRELWNKCCDKVLLHSYMLMVNRAKRIITHSKKATRKHAPRIIQIHASDVHIEPDLRGSLCRARHGYPRIVPEGTKGFQSASRDEDGSSSQKMAD